jgi:hypothetical protein
MHHHMHIHGRRHGISLALAQLSASRGFFNQKLHTVGFQVCHGNAGLMIDLAGLYKATPDLKKGEMSAAAMRLQWCTCASTVILLSVPMCYVLVCSPQPADPECEPASSPGCTGPVT